MTKREELVEKLRRYTIRWGGFHPESKESLDWVLHHQPRYPFSLVITLEAKLFEIIYDSGILDGSCDDYKVERRIKDRRKL